MNIIFDLDGTLIDSSERMYRLFQKLVPQSTLTKDEYWAQKRNKVNHQQLLSVNFPEVDFNEFNHSWMAQIEMSDFLKMDTCYDDTISVLHKLKQEHLLYLLTARQSKDNLMKELQALHLQDFFTEIFVTEAKSSKEQLLRRQMERNANLFVRGDWFVSDMGKDIQVGNQLGFYTIAIAHGFMSKEKLLEYVPKRCVAELTDLITMLQ